MKARTAQDIWEAALGELQIQVNKANYQTWLKDTHGVSYVNGQFVVGVPTEFVAEWLARRLHSLVKKSLIGVVGRDLDVQFRVHPDKQPEAKLAVSSPQPQRQATGDRGLASAESKMGQVSSIRLNHKYTFDSFVVGDCNRLAHAAALRVAENPGVVYNPLFIYGGVGLGKTHLLHAIGHVTSANNIRLVYVTTEQFTNEFITAIREGRTEDFRTKYRTADILLVDDIHFLNGKEQTQEGFFHTFNALHNTNCQIVITSDRHPKSLTLLEDRLLSRFEWGLIADMQPPDLETRLAILQAKAEHQGVDMGDEVLEFIAREVRQNVRELEGGLNRLIAYARLARATPTPELAAQALENIRNKTQRRSLTAPLIIDAVANYFSLPPAALRSRKRDQLTALSRHIAMYLIHEETQCSLAETGRELGGKDHSTVLHGYRRIAAQVNDNSQLRTQLHDIKEMLYLEETR
jgi:chromosomal replication initiator protein